MPAPPQVLADARPLAQMADADAVAVPVWPATRGDAGPWLGEGGEMLTGRFGVDPFAGLEQSRATGRPGECVALAGTGGVRVLLVGLGDGTPRAYRRAGAALARAARDRRRVACSLAAAADDAGLRALVEGVVLASFGWSRRSEPRPGVPAGEVLLAGCGPAREPALARGLAVARAGWLARELAVTPSDLKDPAWLAGRAVEVGESAGVAVRVLDEHALAARGFGGLLGVGAGSVRPPRLVEMAYAPGGGAGPGDVVPHVVLVGKGITFDSGGLSLKPADAMKPMKTDMSGAAAVIATMSALRDLDLPVRVTGLVAAAENMPSGSAQRPGDVLTQYGGTTVEVLNTDAEGRLVLADAMAYAAECLAPDVLVDIATLTGAATLGLGRRHAALFSTDDDLAARLGEAGEAAGERLWRMPLVEDYRFALDSDIADVAHVPTSRVQGGAITAALFLERFAGGLPWAHLDIAGPARADADEHEITKGGTGFGARALLYWLEAAYGPEAPPRVASAAW